MDNQQILSPGRQWKWDERLQDWIPNQPQNTRQDDSSLNLAIDLIKKNFPKDQWSNAYQIMMGESSGNPSAVGDNYPINGQTIPSYGLFQIRALPGRPNPQMLLNPEVNVKYAADLWKKQKWQPWTVARKMGIE